MTTNKSKTRNTLLIAGAFLIGLFTLLSLQSKTDDLISENLNTTSDISFESDLQTKSFITENKCGGGDKKEKAKENTKTSEGKCGAGKCGGEDKKEAKKEESNSSEEGKCGDGKCGGDDKKEAKKENLKASEGKCGAGKCGGA